MSLSLLRDKTAFVEPVGNSGMTDSGIYVFDHDETKDLTGQRTTILYRVLEQKNCDEIIPGRVYLVDNPYNFSTLDYDGARYLVMPQENFLGELEGYDDDAAAIEPEISDSPDLYPVCGK